MDEDYYMEPHAADGLGRVRRWMERLTRRSLADVRVHDSAQAGAMAHRLGARAFTAGRHVYVGPDTTGTLAAQGTALLAHEMWHAAGEPGLALEMPLLSAPARATPAGRGAASTATGVSPALSFQRQPAGAPAGEAVAQSVESAVLDEERRSLSERGMENAPATVRALDPEELAEKVYRLIVRDLISDRERASCGW